MWHYKFQTFKRILIYMWNQSILNTVPNALKLGVWLWKPLLLFYSFLWCVVFWPLDFLHLLPIPRILVPLIHLCRLFFLCILLRSHFLCEESIIHNYPSFPLSFWTCLEDFSQMWYFVDVKFLGSYSNFHSPHPISSISRTNTQYISLEIKVEEMNEWTNKKTVWCDRKNMNVGERLWCLGFYFRSASY